MKTILFFVLSFQFKNEKGNLITKIKDPMIGIDHG